MGGGGKWPSPRGMKALVYAFKSRTLCKHLLGSKIASADKTHKIKSNIIFHSFEAELELTAEYSV